MAAISTFVQPNAKGWKTLRSVTAQATTGQTDWVIVPAWAKTAIVVLNLTANAGTSPETTVTLRAPEPVTRDDTNDHAVLLTGATITAASAHRYEMGENSATDGADSATADAYQNETRVLPDILGVRVLNDRTTGDETYTYTLSILFR